MASSMMMNLSRTAAASATAGAARRTIVAPLALRQCSRMLTTVAAPASHQQTSPLLQALQRNRRTLTRFGIAGIGLGAAQYYLGSADNFFEHKFVTRKQAHDLADFYGTEDFMEIFCVFPIIQNIMMRAASFGDDGTIHAWGLLGPGELEVSIDFDEREEDTDGDGEPDTITWFNKRENFKDQAPSWLGGFTLWEMTQNFGYNRREDGSCVVYHHGEKFRGFFLMRIIFQLHARYVIWATERYVNSDAFGSEEQADVAEELRHNVPLHVFNAFLADLTAQLEQAKKDSIGDERKERELDVTLQRLNTISKMDPNAIRPRVRTLRTRKSMVTQSQLVVDDAEAKDTIKTAMNQIASHSTVRRASLGASASDVLAGRRVSVGGHPSAELQKLQRRVTMVDTNLKPE